MTKHAGSQRVAIFAIMGTSFVVTLGLGALSFALPLFGSDAHLGTFWIGAAFSGYFLARLVFAPLAGKWADSFGPRPVLLGACFGGGLLPLSHFLVPDPYWLFVIQFFLGIAGGLVRPVSMAVLGSLAGTSSLARIFGLHAAFVNAAFFLGPILGGVLYFARSFTPIILFVCFTMALATVLIMALLPCTVRTVRKTAGIGAESGALPLAEKASQFPELMLAIVGRTAGVAIFLAFFPFLLAHHFFASPLEIGLVTSLPSLVACLGLFFWSGRFRLHSQGATISFGIIISSLGLFFMGSCSSLWSFALLCLLAGAGRVISVPVSMELAALSGEAQGRAFGYANAAACIGFVLGPLGAGLVLTQTTEPGQVFHLFGLIGGLFCLPLLLGALWPCLARCWRALIAVFIGIVFCAGLFWAAPKESGSDTTFTYGGTAMGTVLHMTLEAPNRAIADAAAKKARKTVRALQHEFDFRNRHGSIGRVNYRAGTGKNTHVSAQACALLGRALALGEKTNGIFDITIGAVTVTPLYFARSEEIARAKKELIDYRLVQLEPQSQKVLLPRVGMALDLGGIAKGAIIDAVVKVLRQSGVTAGIVEAGGDFYCFGARDWTVGIRHPRSDALLGFITVREKGVCGSGDYYQYVVEVHQGKKRRRHHILDVSTMQSATQSLGVTVVAQSAEEADALATTMLIAGPEQGQSILDRSFKDASALWVLPDLSVQRSDSFPAFFENDSAQNIMQ